MVPSAYTGQGTADTVQETPRLAQLQRGQRREARHGEGRGRRERNKGIEKKDVRGESCGIRRMSEENR